MATKVSTIGIGKLTSTDLYVDQFLVEIYSDSGFTNRIGQKSVPAVWDGAQWTQKQLILFGGLSFGTTYWLRSTTVAPTSGKLGTWSTFNLVAGSATPPNPTYTLVSATTSYSGVTFVVTPVSSPIDLEHYEWTYTVDGSTPGSTVKPKGIVVPDPTSGNLTIFAGATSSQSVKLFLRAINTSQQVQAWTLISTQTPLNRGSLPATYRTAVLGLAPKVYFRLSDMASPFVDESGNGNFGTISGTGTSFDVSGLIAGDNDGAVQFSGTSDISVTNSASLRNNIVTVVFWIKAAAGSQVNTFGGACCMSGQLTTSPGWTFAQNNALTTAILAIATSANNNLVFNFTGTPFDGNIHMIAFAVDGSVGTVYLSIDGAAWSTISFAANKGTGISNSVVPLLVGAQAGGGHAMVGVIDEFALFASVLDQTDIAGLYALGINGVNRSLANIPGQLKGSFNNNPVNTNGLFSGNNPLSQSTATKTILVAAFTLVFGDGAVSYNAGSVTPSNFGTYFVYFRDPTYAGGTVTFFATQNKSDLTAFNDIIAVGTITTASTGGGVGTGGGGHIQFQ